MPELGEVPRNGISYDSYVKVTAFNAFPFDLIELRVHTVRQFGPVRVQSTFPASGVAREQPIFVTIWTETEATLASSLTRTRSLQLQISHQMFTE